MSEKTRSVASLDKTGGAEFLHKLLVGQKGCLGKAIHAAINLKVDKTIAGNGGEVILVYDALGKSGERNFGKFRSIHLGSGQKEIFDVDGHEGSSGGGHCAVEQEFGGGEFSCLGRHIKGIVDSVTAHGGSDSADLFFEGPVGHHKFDVGDVLAASWGNGVKGNELESL